MDEVINRNRKIYEKNYYFNTIKMFGLVNLNLHHFRRKKSVIYSSKNLRNRDNKRWREKYSIKTAHYQLINRTAIRELDQKGSSESDSPLRKNIIYKYHFLTKKKRKYWLSNGIYNKRIL